MTVIFPEAQRMKKRSLEARVENVEGTYLEAGKLVLQHVAAAAEAGKFSTTAKLPAFLKPAYVAGFKRMLERKGYKVNINSAPVVAHKNLFFAERTYVHISWG